MRSLAGAYFNPPIEEQIPEITTLSSHLIQALSIIQGVILNHEPSKQFFGRRFALEVRRTTSYYVIGLTLRI